MANNKKSIYFTTAEDMFVRSLVPLSTIAQRIPVSLRTLVTWKDEGNWEEKQKDYVQAETAFHVRMFKFAGNLMDQIEKEWNDNKKVANATLFGLKGVLNCIPKTKLYEESLKDKDDTDASLQIPKEALQDPAVQKALRIIAEKSREHQ